MLKKQSVVIGLVIAGLLLVWLGWYRYEDKKHQGPQQKTVVVEAAQAKQQEWYDQISATGTLSAFQGIMVRPQVAGAITAIHFDSGKFIEAGQPLLQIYPDILEAQLEKAKAALDLAMVEYRRSEELYKKKAISRQDLDERTSRLNQDQAVVAEIEAQLKQHNINAPFSGRLGLRLVDLGDYVNVGQNIVNLQQLDPIRIEFSVPEIYISRLAIGQQVEVYPSSEPGKKVMGEVYAFDSVVDQDTRALFMRAKIPNEQNKLLPGTFAKVNLLAGKKHPVITVPETAVVFSPEMVYVYKVVNDKAMKTQVTTGTRRQAEVEIKSGLSVGDTVVTAGQVKLSNNAPVKVRNDNQTPSESNKPSQAKESS